MRKVRLILRRNSRASDRRAVTVKAVVAVAVVVRAGIVADPQGLGTAATTKPPGDCPAASAISVGADAQI